MATPPLADLNSLPRQRTWETPPEKRKRKGKPTPPKRRKTWKKRRSEKRPKNKERY